ncbi:hypothetical protein [Actinomadura rubrisoli]|uniref:Uncharacterized protein n=1 Tax=Actinomadura rubrisoli TaxID=2530368 RepID=A0A4R5AH41_9ACTN|nr:hypothetical protein [Actinomadura rubrisoli]TDD69372.1 hypothetical protein E1298_37595 [Actinomadura rubrisoli]
MARFDHRVDLRISCFIVAVNAEPDVEETVKLLARASHRENRQSMNRLARGCSQDTRNRLRAALQHRTAGPDRTPSSHEGHRQLLASAFRHPQGTGFIGPGADGLLRSAFTEALTSKTGVSWILAAKSDLRRLFDDAFDDALREHWSPRLRVVDTLEDAIEHLDFEADIARALNTNATDALLPVLWFTTSGPDTDVIHQTLQNWPDIIALIAGGWPHGPTHLIEADGPRPLPRRPIDLLSPQQAIASLDVPDQPS